MPCNDTMLAILMVIHDTSDLCPENRQAGWLPAAKRLHTGREQLIY